MSHATAPSAGAGPLWYRDAVIYEVHVRAFADSNGDGIGDFPGLIGKLDYLRDLGVTAIWLLPFYPSPLRDDGYDISDYTAVHPAYGTLDYVRELLDEAHRRGLKVITELVLNHTSDQHPWFQSARRAPTGSPERDFYVWSPTPDRYREARIIFPDYEQSNWAWDDVAGAYYWHRFYGHQPDLNYDHPPVRKAIFGVVDFWLGLGADGLRLDAVPYLIEREGTICENLPETHAFLRELRRHIDARFPDRMLLAEANQWPEDAVAYFGAGDECHMAFDFPLMPRLFMAVQAEDRLPVLDIMAQTPPIPDTCQWALFLRNHDELTLEMVTDEERLWMYRAYAGAEEARVNLGIRRRLAPLLGNSRRRIELLNALLCSLQGTPVIYYGDEIGMGDNIFLGDRDGVRTPMQWNADRNAGFSTASPQRLYLPLITDYEYHWTTVQVEAQEQNPHSLLAFMKRLLALRQLHRAFGRGTLTMLHPDNHRVLAFVREHGDERILVVANLSRFSQAVELDLRAWRGCTPVELFGRTAFWPIDGAPYRLTLGPHAFHWLALSPQPAAGEEGLPLIATTGAASTVVQDERGRLAEALPGFLGRQPWFRGAATTVLGITVIDAIPLPGGPPTWLLPITVSYSDRAAESYLVVPQLLPDQDEPSPAATIARVRDGAGEEALLVDAIEAGTVDSALDWLTDPGPEALAGDDGRVVVVRSGAGALAGPVVTSHVDDRPGRRRAGRILVKVLRRINEGVNPEWEIGAALTRAGFPHAPTVLGAFEYRRASRPPVTLAVIQAFVPNEGNAWDWTLATLDAQVDAAQDQGLVMPADAPPGTPELLAAADEVPPEPLAELIAPSLAFARLLGERTAKLHAALAGIADPAFTPEPELSFSRRSLYQSMRGLASRTIRDLRVTLPTLGAPDRAVAEALLDREPELHARLRTVLAAALTGEKIRTHGDFHLEQVLRTRDDLVFVDFEGEPDRYLEERRLKSTPLRDVASMLHSLRDAALRTGASRAADPDGTAEQRASVKALTRAWFRWSAAAFLGAYRRGASGTRVVPADAAEWETLIDALMLERAVYALDHALGHAPADVPAALRSLGDLLGLDTADATTTEGDAT